MDKRKIYVIRHAQSEGNLTKTFQGQLDAKLTQKGLRQIELISNYFQSKQKEFQIKNIFSSDLQRAALTAKGIAEKIGLNVEIEKDFQEANYGRWQGVSKEEIEKSDPKEYQEWNQDKRKRPNWCESFDSTSLRAKKAIVSSLKRSEGNFVVLSHGGTIHSIIGLCKGSSYISESIRNCSITKIQASIKPNSEELELELLELNFVIPELKNL